MTNPVTSTPALGAIRRKSIRLQEDNLVTMRPLL